MTRKFQSLALEKPAFLSEWDYEKNLPKTPNDVSLMSARKIWWKCNKNHSWEAIVSSRSKNNCPYCANKKVCLENSLEANYPEIAKQWDIIKNKDLTPKNVTPFSGKMVWWICENKHSYKTRIYDKTSNKSHCTQCKGIIIRDRKIINPKEGFRICKDCDCELELSKFRTKKYKNSTSPDNICKNCSNTRVNEYRNTPIGIAANIVRRLRYVAKIAKIPFDLDKKWVFERLNQLQWRCELTNLLLINTERIKNEMPLGSLSVDRIIPMNGYVKTNIRFIINQVNIFRSTGGDELMYKIAEALIANKK